MAAACVLCALLAACGARPWARSILARTRSVLLTERFTLGRPVGLRSERCERPDAAPADPPAPCSSPLRAGSDDFARFERLAGEVRRAAAADSGPSTLHSMALVDLRFAAGSRAARERAVASLERARASAPNDPTLLNDVAVAYLEIGVRDRQLEPMLRALDAVNQALRHDSTLVEVLYNRSLVLHHLGLVAGARAAWATVLGAEREVGWTREARAHVQDLALGADTLTARDYPQQARDAVFRLLGDWGSAARGGDGRRADSLLAVAASAADSLDRLRADRTVRLVVEWLGAAAREPHRRREAGRALVDFSAGVRFTERGDYEHAEPALVAAEGALRRLRSPVARWAALHRASAAMNQGRYAEADRRLRALVREASADEPALRGRAVWLRGTVALRQGDFEAANRFYADARGYLAAAKDAKSEASLSFVLTDGLALAGRTTESFAEAQRGLQGLAAYRQTVALHNQLLGVAALARTLGLRYAALDLVDEALDVSRTLRRPDVLVLALCTRARDLAALGDSTRALADLDGASRVAETLGGASRRLAVTSIELARGRLLRARDPRAALALLTHAADEYRAIGVWAYASAALYELALVARDAGETEVARARLLESIALMERTIGSFTSAEARSAFDETVEKVFDAIVELELDAGRPALAYEYLEQERSAVWRDVPRPAPARPDPPGGALASIARSLPRDHLFLSYAVLPDRVVIWFASRDGWGHRSVPVPRDSLAALVGRFSREIAGTTAAELRTRARLFSLMLAPIAERLAGVRHLAVVPDRELARVPVAALWNPATGRYVAADQTVRTEPSGAFLQAVSSVARPGGPKGSALVVGDPALDSALAAQLGALPGARREAREIASLYPGASPLSGAGASRAAVVRALARTPVFHFAGHAVFDGGRPELSYLALAPDGAGGSGRLEAREIAAMRLSNVDVVVLSACSTLNSRPTRTGAVAGLAYSFLRAGVPATVSTLWDVDDAAVVEFLVELHRSIQRGIPAPEALRRAQVGALTSPRPELRAPAVWAAFVYSGP